MLFVFSTALEVYNDNLLYTLDGRHITILKLQNAIIALFD